MIRVETPNNIETADAPTKLETEEVETTIKSQETDVETIESGQKNNDTEDKLD
jgi:hypothetical protein